ncbi:hypothetical protein GGR57DRAFT_102927 [Xylariaceae sp. FL1272]|nr:hypothetical protein GGR57DRAFT_102927 [Xylariaceae sp. FL1272]
MVFSSAVGRLPPTDYHMLGLSWTRLGQDGRARTASGAVEHGQKALQRGGGRRCLVLGLCWNLVQLGLLEEAGRALREEAKRQKRRRKERCMLHPCRRRWGYRRLGQTPQSDARGCNETREMMYPLLSSRRCCCEMSSSHHAHRLPTMPIHTYIQESMYCSILNSRAEPNEPAASMPESDPGCPCLQETVVYFGDGVQRSLQGCLLAVWSPTKTADVEIISSLAPVLCPSPFRCVPVGNRRNECNPCDADTSTFNCQHLFRSSH